MKYCEMCGMEVEESNIYRVNIEGTILNICNSCYSRLISKDKQLHQNQQGSAIIKTKESLHRKLISSSKPAQNISVGMTSKNKELLQSTKLYENYELVEDYAEKIRRARERFGWSQAILAEKIKTSENIIKRIESGKLRPTYDLAKKLENVLKIRLLVPSVEEDVFKQKIQKYITLGEIVNIRESK